MVTTAKRVGWIVLGVFVLFANNGGGEPGTVLGFSTAGGTGSLGYNITKAIIAVLALLAIYRGLRTRTPKAAAYEKGNQPV